MSEWVKDKIDTRNYRAWVGDSTKYDLIGTMVSAYVEEKGLKSTDLFCDIGCGSLRIGQHIIKYLREGNYFGIEANYWLIEEAVKHEIGLEQLLDEKKPHFRVGFDFNLKSFDIEFDFILAHSIIIHACNDQLIRIFDQVRNTLRLGGTFMFNYIPGESNKLNRWSYPSHVTYHPVKLKKMLSDFIIKEERFFDRDWFICTKAV